MIDKTKLVRLADAMSAVGEAQDAEKAFKSKHAAVYDEAANYAQIVKIARDKVSDIKTEIQQEALGEYDETGKKKLSGGIGIRSKTVLEYDAAKAMEYAVKHGQCLALDVKSFEAVAVALKLDFVQVNTVNTVTFPKEVKLDE